jgi:hypothetical protein
MKRFTKIAYFSFLALISVSQFFQGNILLGAILTIMTCIAIPFYEKREAKRQFYRTLRKLYVCVDLNAFIKERDFLVKHALIKSVISMPLNLLNIIESYYRGERASIVPALSSLPRNVDYVFWIDSYLGLCDVSRVEPTNLRRLLDKVPSYYREIACQRIEVLELKRNLLDINEADTGEIDKLREEVTCNLLIAELTQCLMVRAQNDRIRSYYEQAVLNLSKGLML